MKLLQIILAIVIGLASTVLYQHRESISDIVSFVITSPATQYNEVFPQGASNETNLAAKASESNFHHHLTTTEMSVPRAIAKVVRAIEQSEGAGARVRRSIGTREQRNFSPFLMLDHFSTTAGFPDQYVVFLSLSLSPLLSSFP
jgi:hypothetical protein